MMDHLPLFQLHGISVLMHRFRVKVLAGLQPLSSSISLCSDPSTGCVFGCCTPSTTVNSFSTSLILGAICIICVYRLISVANVRPAFHSSYFCETLKIDGTVRFSRCF